MSDNPVTWHDNGRGPRVVITLARVDHVVGVDAARQLLGAIGEALEQIDAAAGGVGGAPAARACEDCGQPGGEVTIERAGVVVWRRVLCEACFDERRLATQQQTGLAVAKVVPA